MSRNYVILVVSIVALMVVGMLIDSRSSKYAVTCPHCNNAITIVTQGDKANVVFE